MHRQVPLHVTYMTPTHKDFGTDATLQVGATSLSFKKGESGASEKSKLHSAAQMRMNVLNGTSAVNPEAGSGRQSSQASAAKDVKQVLS